MDISNVNGIAGKLVCLHPVWIGPGIKRACEVQIESKRLSVW